MNTQIVIHWASRVRVVKTFLISSYPWRRTKWDKRKLDAILKITHTYYKSYCNPDTVTCRALEQNRIPHASVRRLRGDLVDCSAETTRGGGAPTPRRCERRNGRGVATEEREERERRENARSQRDGIIWVSLPANQTFNDPYLADR